MIKVKKGDFPAGTEIRTVNVDGQDLRVGMRGEGDTPLVLLNGIAAQMELMSPFIAALPDVRTITVDMPGVGGSPLPRRPYDLRDMAKLIDGLTRKLEVPRIDLLGVSWGGMLAQQFAYQFPERCRKLVLACTATGMFTSVPALPSAMMKMMSLGRFAVPGVDGHQPTRDLAGDPDDEAFDSWGFRYQIMAMAGWTSAFWLHRLRQPTLILAGSRDKVTPILNAHMMDWRIPNSSLRIFDDGHMLLHSSAAAAAATVGEFLRPQ